MMWVFSVMWCGVGWGEAPVVHHLGFHFHSFPLQGEGEVETCISVELSSTPADASSCLRPDHGDTPITSQALREWECTGGWRLTVLGGRVAELRWGLGG